MPVTIVKAKPSLKTKIATEAANEADLQLIARVDALVVLKKASDEAKKVVKKFEAARDLLKDLIPPNAPADEAVEFKGTTHKVEFSAQAEQRVIVDMKAVHKKLGDKAFYELAKISLGDLDKYLSEIEQEKVVEKARTGSRTCSVKEL